MQVLEITRKKYAPLSASQKAETEAKIKKMQKEGEKLIRGMFEFTDAGGGWLDFDYRFYPGEPVRKLHIVHGEIFDCPKDLAVHLNNVYKKIRVLKPNLDGGVDTVTKTSRTRFIPMEMM